MTNDEINKEVERLFGGKRIALLKTLSSCADKLPIQIEVEEELLKETGCRVKSSNGLSKDVYDWIVNGSGDIKQLGFDPEDRTEHIGDTSFNFLILLNKNIKDPLDFDEKLAERYGKLFFCEVWASLVLPYYTYDVYYWDYSKKDNCQEWGPHKTTKKQEAQIIDRMQKVMKGFKFNRISKKTAKTYVEKAVTDTLGKGDASVFDCLFSDMTFYQETIRRMNIERVDFPELSAVGSWNESYDKKQKLSEKRLHLQFLDKDDMTIVMDSEGTIKKFEVCSRPHGKIKHQWVAYDTSDKTGCLRKKHKKHLGMAWI